MLAVIHDGNVTVVRVMDYHNIRLVRWRKLCEKIFPNHRDQYVETEHVNNREQLIQCVYDRQCVYTTVESLWSLTVMSSMAIIKSTSCH